MNTVTIFPVFDTQRPQGYVIIINCVFKQANAYPHGSQFRVIGDTKQFRGYNTADINHGRLRQLLYTFRDNVSGKLPQFTKINSRFPWLVSFFRGPAFQRQVEIECRDISYTGLDHFRTLHVLGQCRHSTIQLLVNVNKNDINIAIRFKIHVNSPRIRPCFCGYILQSRHLRQLVFQRFQKSIIHLSNR